MGAVVTFTATAPPVDILWYADNPEVVMVASVSARTAPELALTIGTLKPGADDQGLVPAVAVTVWTDERAISPLEALTTGTLNPGALDHGLVAAVAVTVGVPDI